jgi:hypothetical protein
VADDVRAVDDVVREFYDIRGNERMSAAIREAAEKIREAAKAGKPVSGASIADFRTRLNTIAAKPLGDANTHAASKMSEALDGMLERGISRTDRGLYGELKQAREQYRTYKTILRALNREGSDVRAGLISPSALSTAARQREGEKYLIGEGRTALGNLAFAGEEVAGSLPSVAPGAVRYIAGAIPAAGALTGSIGGIPGAAAGAAAGVGGQAAGRSALRLGPVQRGLMPPEQLMLERLLGRTAPLTGGLLAVQD